MLFKFAVTEIKSRLRGALDAHATETQIILSPVTSGSGKKNELYSPIPGGSMELVVINPVVEKFFELGAEYYIDFTKAVPDPKFADPAPAAALNDLSCGVCGRPPMAQAEEWEDEWEDGWEDGWLEAAVEAAKARVRSYESSQ